MGGVRSGNQRPERLGLSTASRTPGGAAGRDPPRTCPRLLPHARGNGDCSLDGHWSFGANPGKLAGPVPAHPKAVGRKLWADLSSDFHSLHSLETGFPAGCGSSWSTLRGRVPG